MSKTWWMLGFLPGLGCSKAGLPCEGLLYSCAGVWETELAGGPACTLQFLPLQLSFWSGLAGPTPLQKQKGQVSNPAALRCPVSLLSPSPAVQPLGLLLSLCQGNATGRAGALHQPGLTPRPETRHEACGVTAMAFTLPEELWPEEAWPRDVA